MFGFITNRDSKLIETRVLSGYIFSQVLKKDKRGKVLCTKSTSAYFAVIQVLGCHGHPPVDLS